MRLFPVLIFVLTFFPPTLGASPPPLRGVVLQINQEDPDFDYTPFVEEVAALGASHISFLFPYYVKDAQSVEIFRRPGKTPSEATLREIINTARDAGLGVMLFPIVLLEENTGEDWRGSLRPENLHEWFESYTRMIVGAARLAEQEEVEILSIGSELSSLQGYDGFWARIAREVREVYTGEILYTSNWDTIDWSDWWGSVDYLGVSGYYELADEGETEATTGTLARNWGKWKSELLEIRKERAPDKPIIFSEIGYPSMDGGAVYPWDYTRDAPRDLEEQRRAFEAFIRTWDGEPALHGAFVYTWFEFSPDSDRGYTIRGKPAGELIRSWYQSGD